ncbi:MAG: isoprenylcysteine carboxylmethyltransferase family protein [Firmicutes bacterium]|nr:isoprenylcysteine carboxylmethyltransferase family protein [Bacillota bacterium]
MNWRDWVAAVVLFVELPVPVFWLIFHTLAATVRPRPRFAYLAAGLTAWLAGGTLIISLREFLFAGTTAPIWATTLGLLLIASDLSLFWRAERAMGTQRMVGRAELAGAQQLASSGIYTQLRHPRYLGMILAVVGTALLAGTLLLWVLVLAWFGLVLVMLRVEEWELRRRMGPAYDEYCRRVPAMLPFRGTSRD